MARFPRPWSQQHNDSAWWVQAANGKKFAFCYVERPGVVGDSYMSEDEARRLTANFAKLGATPEG